MKRNTFSIDAIGEAVLKSRLPPAVSEYEHAAFYDSNEHSDLYSRYNWIAALGAVKILSPEAGNSFEDLRNFLDQHRDWLFGHLTYDLKNELELLETKHEDQLNFPKLQFFIPETVIYSKPGEIIAESTLYDNQYSLLAALPVFMPPPASGIELHALTSRNTYLDQVRSLKDHIQRGNIYEVNYCIEFAAQAENFVPAQAFNRLNQSSKAPFSAFYKCDKNYLLCASPERYLQKSGSKIISQPIKGTAKRSADAVLDNLLKQELYHSAKERSENVMITDLVRNDLSRTAIHGSVKVEELFGIYSFNTVHQMITTISSTLDEEHDITDLLKTTFPMGSMTGAPKVRAMKLIEEHENFARSLYAGSVGYITPSGNFDFNVVIRSLFYNKKSSYLSARVGSAITIYCDAEQEYEECLLKAANLFRSLKPEALATD